MWRSGKHHEFYTEKAKEEGYPARSVYKLEEIDSRFHIFRKGDRVLDLGCAPGSWLLYISKRIGKGGRVIGVDTALLTIQIPNNATIFSQDVLSLTKDSLKEKFDVIVSDLAPATTGIVDVDVARSLELSEKALRMAEDSLKKGGSFICKVFEGAGSSEFFTKLKPLFLQARLYRPKAVLKTSKEIYVVAKDFRRS